ncbi:MAG: PIN domain-containing protein [Pirellulales bacterium]
MTATHFVDTNVLLYAASNALADQPNRLIARQVLEDPSIGFSAQVLQEFYAAAVTKQRLQMTHDEAAAVLASLSAFPVWPITRDLVLEAVAAKQRFQVSYWDAAILTAAKQMGCHTIYSEDLDHSRDYDGVRVVNPFTANPSTVTD